MSQTFVVIPKEVEKQIRPSSGLAYHYCMTAGIQHCDAFRTIAKLAATITEQHFIAGTCSRIQEAKTVATVMYRGHP